MIQVLPSANADVREALAWLTRQKRYRVADRLWDFWLKGLDAIEATPRLFSRADDAPAGVEVRNYILPRYGYRIVYRVSEGDVLVVAFARGRRNPGHYQARLREYGETNEGLE